MLRACLLALFGAMVHHNGDRIRSGQFSTPIKVIMVVVAGSIIVLIVLGIESNLLGRIPNHLNNLVSTALGTTDTG